MVCKTHFKCPIKQLNVCYGHVTKRDSGGNTNARFAVGQLLSICACVIAVFYFER